MLPVQWQILSELGWITRLYSENAGHAFNEVSLHLNKSTINVSNQETIIFNVSLNF